MIEDVLNFPSLILIALSAQYEIEDVSPAAELYFGRSRKKLCGQSIFDILPKAHPLTEFVTREVPFSIYDQSYYWLDASTEHFDIHQIEKPGGFLVFLYPKPRQYEQDQTHHAHGAIRQTTGMAAMLAHELRNPLSTIRGGAQLVAMNADPDDLPILKVIEEESARIGSLVNEFEEMAGESTAAITSVNIYEILNQVLRAAKVGYAHEIDFVEIYDPSLPEIAADPDRLRRALSNIIKNASEAIGAHRDQGGMQGRIHVQTRYRRGIMREFEKLPVEISISDNGGGMEETLIRDAFKPFVTTKTNGTGLGLPMVARMVEEVGGVIEVQNNERGCEFRMLFPIWRENWKER